MEIVAHDTRLGVSGVIRGWCNCGIFVAFVSSVWPLYTSKATELDGWISRVTKSNLGSCDIGMFEAAGKAVIHLVFHTDCFEGNLVLAIDKRIF